MTIAMTNYDAESVGGTARKAMSSCAPVGTANGANPEAASAGSSRAKRLHESERAQVVADWLPVSPGDTSCSVHREAREIEPIGRRMRVSQQTLAHGSSHAPPALSYAVIDTVGCSLFPLIEQELQPLLETWLKQSPMGRLAEFGDCQGTIIYLASEVSEYVNGTIAIIDGGQQFQ